MVTEEKKRKILKLGNWHVHLLDKLNQQYLKGDLCDVNLKFSDDKSIQAHKVVLSACTSFFDHLPSSSAGVVLHMPKLMKCHHVTPIINFMYTGKLEYLPEDQAQIYVTAKHLGMHVLTELLQVQQSPISVNKKIDPKGVYRKCFVHKTLKPNGPQEVPLTDETPPPPTSPGQQPTSLPGKKLPIWKKRTTVQLPQEFYQSVNKAAVVRPIVSELPLPTRFDWPEEAGLPDPGLTQCGLGPDSYSNLSYDCKVIVKPATDPKPIVSEDSIERVPYTPSEATHPAPIRGRRPRCYDERSEPLLGGPADRSTQPPPRAEIRDRKRTKESELLSDNREDEDDYDDGHFETIHSIDDGGGSEDEGLIVNTNTKSVYTPPKPILKTTPSPTPSKKVRFSFTDNKMEVNNKLEVPLSPLATPLSSISEPALPVTSSPASSSPAPSSTAPGPPINHAKIINEILKKYPNLVKNNKNIKLKIQSGGGAPTQGSVIQNTSLPDKDGKGLKKVQYVVLKSDITNAKKDHKTDIVMGAENRTGPWFCVPCGDEKSPMNFETYYTYRKHLQEVHNERIDSRICEHCGFKASKRNLHLYHLYTKHNVPPPRNVNFPKCDQCNYIALSESLLIKHRSNHTGMVTREFICRICNAAFKSNGALMGHMQTNLHHTDQPVKKDYECEYCGKVFNRNINLKAHIRTSHQELARKVYDDEEAQEVQTVSVSEPRSSKVMEIIELPIYDAGPTTNKTLYLPQSMTIIAENPAMPLMPSSESEAMNNVATGIATSINITDRNIPNDVIVIDGNSDIIIRGTPATYVLNQDGTYSVQEYIVPEIMSESGGQVYTTGLVSSSAPSPAISYVTTDNISLVTSTADHTYAGGEATLTVPTVITSQVQVPSPVIVQDTPIIMNANWVQTEQSLNIDPNQKVEILTNQVSEAQPAVAERLVSDWGDLDDDGQDEGDAEVEEESDVKPSRPTIDLDQAEIDM